MKVFTRETDYAIRALCCIAGREEAIVSVDELVKALKMPRPFLRKILQLLNKKGIVRSLKGKGGGFSLAAGPERISLLDVIEAFQGPVRLNDHRFKKKLCPEIKTCLIKRKIDRIEKMVIAELKKVDISSLL